jgi:hypothetical protein
LFAEGDKERRITEGWKEETMRGERTTRRRQRGREDSRTTRRRQRGRDEKRGRQEGEEDDKKESVEGIKRKR